MPETAVFDHYEVLTRDDGSLFELGRGAMGITYKAFDTSLRIPVALKVINATYLNSEVARQRFVREARSAAQLRHRHVASVFHLGTEGDTWFYAMEFIDGETLDGLIKRQGPLAPVLALTITAQVARALNAASQHGLVHRDIKPANLMLVKEDDELVAKVIDFGLAKASVVADGEDAATLSMGGFVGTPHFASPEQLEERELDSRSDIYSLGVTLWYMLAGQAPFAGSMAQVMSQHLSKPPPFEKLEKLPAAVAEVLRLMLAKDPGDRYQSPADLRKGVEVAIEKITSAGGAAPMTAEAVEQSEDFATLLEDSAVLPGPGSFETNTTIANRYRVAQSCGETNVGRVFRAYDTQRKAEVRLIVLHAEALADSMGMSALEREVDKLLSVKHPNLLGVLGFETVDRGSFLVLEWTEGFSVLDLLKARRELDADEALQLLGQAAEGADEALKLSLNNLEFGLHQLHIHFPQQVEKEKLLRAPLSTWPAFELKLYPLSATRDFAASQTWAGGQTMVGGGPDKSVVADADSRAHYVQALAAVTYEVLGGTLSPLSLRAGGPTARYTPLSTLSEEGNEVLRKALDLARSFPSAREFSVALSKLDGLQVRRHEPRAAASVAPALPKAAPAKSPQAGTTPPPAPKTPPVPKTPHVPTPFTPPAPKTVPIALIGGIAAVVVVIFAGVAFLFLHPKPPKPGDSGDPGAHGSSTGGTSSDTGPVVADNTPVATPIPATPIPVTPIPVTPIPVTPPPGPSRQELLRTAVNTAQELEDKGEYQSSLRAWLDVAKNYSDFPVGKNHLETMLNHLRERPSPITGAEFKEMREMITEGAQLGVTSGMMLIADNVRDQEPETAFTWYAKAAEAGIVPAMTQLGLMYSNVTVGTPDMVKAARSFQMAADKGDVSAKYLLGECYMIGKGVEKDESKALELFRQGADAGELRSMNRLGDCYVHGIGGKIDLPEAFRIFSKAADLGSFDALGNLGVLYVNGDTPDHKVDPRKAVELWKKGVEKQNPFCMWLYARSLENGIGVTKNALLARGMYQKAAELGERHAVDWCRKNFVPFTPVGG